MHLMESSSGVTLNGKPIAFPNVLDLVLGRKVGGRTIITEAGTYVFTFDKVIISESPDIVFGEYDRQEYKFDLFVGGKDGAWIVPGAGSMTHAIVYGSLYKKGFIEKKPAVHGEFNVYHSIGVPSWVTQVGNLTEHDVTYNGVILYQQGHIPLNMISFWSHVGAMALGKMISEYTINKYGTPIAMEYPHADNEHLDMPWRGPFERVKIAA